MDDDQDMEDMYLGRRRGEDALLALEHMANIAESYSEGTQTDDEEGGGNGDGVLSPSGITMQQQRNPAEVCCTISAISATSATYAMHAAAQHSLTTMHCLTSPPDDSSQHDPVNLSCQEPDSL